MDVEERNGRQVGVVRGDSFAPGGEFSGPWGLLAPGQAMAMAADRYRYEAGLSEEELRHMLGLVAVGQRKHATTNPRAKFFNRPLTMDDYLHARIISTPLCLFDYTPESDGGVAFVVANERIAARGPKTPVQIEATLQYMPPKRSLVPLNHDIWTGEVFRSAAREFLAAAHVEPDDIDVALLYEATSVHVPATLEAYGLVPQYGSYKAIVEGDVLGLDSRLPVNTHGGHLSEAYIHGANHILEAVQQLRHEAVNQVPDAQRALYASETACAAILRRREL
jgi:acetyl-CoA acetyltransferase